MKTNYLRSDIIMIIILCILFLSIFVFLTWYNIKTGQLMILAEKLFNIIF